MSKAAKSRFGITMSPELLEQIEKMRGLVPRATYIEYCLKQYFDLQNTIKEGVKFYDEILMMLPEKASLREDPKKLRTLIESVRTKILEKKRMIQT